MPFHETPVHYQIAAGSELERAQEIVREAFSFTAGFPVPSSALTESLSHFDGEERLTLLGMSEGEAVLAVRLRWGKGRFGRSQVERVVEGTSSELEGPAFGGLWFERLAVHPARQGRGLGKQGIKQIEIWARLLGAGRVQASARSQYPDMRNFYTSLGYRITGYSEAHGIPNLRTHLEKTLF